MNMNSIDIEDDTSGQSTLHVQLLGLCAGGERESTITAMIPIYAANNIKEDLR